MDDKIKSLDTQADKLRCLIKESDDLKVSQDVLDVPTLKLLYKLSTKNVIKALGGIVSTGKEANVFHAQGDNRELAIKIYRINTSNFKAMSDYLFGDHRFANVRHNKRDIIFAWAKKEYRNLIRASEAGVRVPKAIEYRNNILVMEFIGIDGRGMPQLKDVDLDNEDGSRIFETIVEYMRRLYVRAGLVHGDLNEFNTLIDTDLEPIIIDVGQSVMLDHPRAEEFLMRDIRNIMRFFKKYGVNITEEEMISRITRADPSDSKNDQNGGDTAD